MKVRKIKCFDWNGLLQWHNFECSFDIVFDISVWRMKYSKSQENSLQYMTYLENIRTVKRKRERKKKLFVTFKKFHSLGLKMCKDNNNNKKYRKCIFLKKKNRHAKKYSWNTKMVWINYYFSDEIRAFQVMPCYISTQCSRLWMSRLKTWACQHSRSNLTH